MGPVIKTSMTRCIQCTRCVRFAEEVAGTPELGMLYRGEDAQITAYLERALTSELSGNLADLCPVGALLQAPQNFEYRPWELRKIPSIDVMDAVGSNIRLDVRGPQVMRILPRINEDVNEEWISDKTRHHADALVRNRLDRPWLREGGKLRAATWAEALELFAAQAQECRQQGGGDCRRSARCRDDVRGEEAARRAGVKPARRAADRPRLRRDLAFAVAFNSTLAGIETADAILLIGTNPRWEAPLVNTRLLKASRRAGAAVFSVGPVVDLTYPVDRPRRRPVAPR